MYVCMDVCVWWMDVLKSTATAYTAQVGLVRLLGGAHDQLRAGNDSNAYKACSPCCVRLLTFGTLPSQLLRQLGDNGCIHGDVQPCSGERAFQALSTGVQSIRQRGSHSV